MKECDVVVVGGGAAGLSAALVLVRARRTVVLVDAGAPRNAPAAHLHGFLSRDGMPPRELLAAGRSEVSSYGGRLIDDTVVAIEAGFQVRLASGSSQVAFRGVTGDRRHGLSAQDAVSWATSWVPVVEDRSGWSVAITRAMEDSDR
jgi:thioredoxin reductase